MNSSEKPKKEATQNPGKEDVHEQREPDQQREGVVRKDKKDEKTSRTSLSDRERADWEGMGQPAPSPQSGR